MTVRVAELLPAWSDRLRSAGVPSPEHDSRALAAHVLGIPPVRMALVESLSDADAARVSALVARRALREPLQHILGTAPFLDLELAVGPGVFIPRPETEAMADFVIEWLRHSDADPHLVVDLCAGSGALTLAVATHVPRSRVTGVEISQAALEYARRNLRGVAGRLESTTSRVSFVQDDARAVPAELSEDLGRVDLVVCNPPYIPEDAVPRDPEVARYDPPAALYGGPDGFAVVRPLVEVAATLLRPGGLLAIEHGDEQGGTDGVPGLVRAHGGGTGFHDVRDHLDLAGRPRFTTAVRGAAVAASGVGPGK